VTLAFALAAGANKKIFEEMKKAVCVGLDGIREKGYDDLTWYGEAFLRSRAAAR